MTDKELLSRIYTLLTKKSRWAGNPKSSTDTAYVTFIIKDYADVVIDLGKRIDQINEEEDEEEKEEYCPHGIRYSRHCKCCECIEQAEMRSEM